MSNSSPNLPDSSNLILGLSTTKHWLQNVADYLRLPGFILPKKTFADKEILVEIPISIRNCDVFLCQSTSSPANETFMELLIAIDALKRASVNSISLVIPYFGYARQDRKAQAREPITAKVIANLLTYFQIKRIITFDLHSPQIQGFFDIPIDHLTLLPQMLSHLLKQKINNYVLIAPDHGGFQRVKKLSEYLHVNVAILGKTRPQINDTNVSFLLGDVKDKNIIFVDDIIDTANTLIKSLEYLRKKKANSAFVVAVHPVFSQGALDKLLVLYQKGWLKKVLVSDSIFVTNKKRYPFLEIYPITQDVGNIIRLIRNNSSLSQYSEEQFCCLKQFRPNE